LTAPCGRVCADCPIFGTSCEGCEREMSFSYSYHCRNYDRKPSGEAQECTGMPCKVVDGKVCHCPLIVQKSLKSLISNGPGPNTPVE